MIIGHLSITNYLITWADHIGTNPEGASKHKPISMDWKDWINAEHREYENHEEWRTDEQERDLVGTLFPPSWILDITFFRNLISHSAYRVVSHPYLVSGNNFRYYYLQCKTCCHDAPFLRVWLNAMELSS
jgi:hypothetical protein